MSGPATDGLAPEWTKRRTPWHTMAWARSVRTGSPGTKAVLMVLAEHADEANSCWPSQQTIAESTEQSVRNVQRQLGALEAAGFIRRQHRYPAGGAGRTSDRYVLILSQPDNLSGNATLHDKSEGLHDTPGTRLHDTAMSYEHHEHQFRTKENEDLNSKKQPSQPNEDPIARHQRAQREKAEAHMEQMRSEEAPPDHELNRRKLKELREGKKGSTIEP